MSNQYYLNPNGNSPASDSVLPAYASGAEGSVSMHVPIPQQQSVPYNNNHNNNKMEASNSGSMLKLLIVTTILSMMIAIVAIVLSIRANTNANNAKDDTKNALNAFSLAIPAMVNSNNNNNNNNNPSSSSSSSSSASSSVLSSAVYAQAFYQTKGGPPGKVSVSGEWYDDDDKAPPVKVPSDGTYLVLTTCRAILNHLDAYWTCRLIRNQNTATPLTSIYGGKMWGPTTGNADGSVSGFWIGQLSKDDLIRQQYMIDGASTTFSLYCPSDTGASSIQLVKIGA